MRTHRHVIKFPVFRGFEIRVSFVEDLKREAERLNTDTSSAEESAYTVLDSNGWATIVLRHNPDAEVVAHESFHAIWALMKWAGAELEDEVVAYHLGHVVGLITKWGNKYGAKNA